MHRDHGNTEARLRRGEPHDHLTDGRVQRDERKIKTNGPLSGQRTSLRIALRLADSTPQQCGAVPELPEPVTADRRPTKALDVLEKALDVLDKGRVMLHLLTNATHALDSKPEHIGMRASTSLDESPEALREVRLAIARAKEGDRDAIRLLYIRYSDNVYGYVRSIVRDDKEAEDLTQHVFMKLITVIVKYNDHGVPVLGLAAAPGAQRRARPSAQAARRRPPKRSSRPTAARRGAAGSRARPAQPLWHRYPKSSAT